MVAGAEGHFGRQAEQVAAGVGLFEALEFLGVGGLGDEELVTDLDRWRDGGGGAGPVGAGELADAATELLGDHIGLLLGRAEDLEADRLAAFDDVHDEIRVAAEAVFPGIEPLGGGEFRPDEHAEGFKFQRGSAKCQSRREEFHHQVAKVAKFSEMGEMPVLGELGVLEVQPAGNQKGLPSPEGLRGNWSGR